MRSAANTNGLGIVRCIPFHLLFISIFSAGSSGALGALSPLSPLSPLRAFGSLASAVYPYGIIGGMIGIRNEMSRVHKEICWKGICWKGICWKGICWKGICWKGICWKGICWKGICWKGIWNTPEIENQTPKSIWILREIRNPMWISEL